MFLRSGGRNEYSARSYASRRDSKKASRALYRSAYGKREGLSAKDWIGIIVIPLFVVGSIAIACITPQLIPESVAYSTAKGLGYTDVNVTDREWLFIQYTGCASDDSVKFTVLGTNPSGEQQMFYVCAGFFKGGTPRFP